MLLVTFLTGCRDTSSPTAAVKVDLDECHERVVRENLANLESDDEARREMGGRILARCKNGVGPLCEVLRNGSVTKRRTAAKTLREGRAYPDVIVPALIRALEDEDAVVKINACDSLGTFGDKASAALPALEKLAPRRDPDKRTKPLPLSPGPTGTANESILESGVRGAAKEAIERIRQEQR